MGEMQHNTLLSRLSTNYQSEKETLCGDLSAPLFELRKYCYYIYYLHYSDKLGSEYPSERAYLRNNFKTPRHVSEYF